MKQLWREIYFRISIFVGALALILIKTGFSADLSKYNEALHKPLPRAASANGECWQRLSPWALPTRVHCRTSLAQHRHPSQLRQGLDNKTIKNIF